MKPKYFVVEKNESNPLWKIYIDWLNKTYNQNWYGGSYDYYGYDGDGCISKTLKDSLMFTICGGINVLTGIQNILIKQCLLNKTKLIKNKSIFNLCYGGNLQVKRIYEWLYKDCEDLYLKRKKEKFE